MTDRPIGVVLVDDDQLVRRGLADWLALLPGIRIIGEAADSAECLELLRARQPDIVLVDIILPGVSGIEVIRQIGRLFPGIRCIVLSGTISPELVFDAYASGAWGFLPKSTSADEVLLALKSVREGNWFLSPVITGLVLKRAHAHRIAATPEKGPGEVEPLTDREREVLKLVAEGQSSADIARELGINSRSVDRVRERIEEKIGSQSLADLVRQAIKLGLVHP